MPHEISAPSSHASLAQVDGLEHSTKTEQAGQAKTAPAAHSSLRQSVGQAFAAYTPQKLAHLLPTMNVDGILSAIRQRIQPLEGALASHLAQLGYGGGGAAQESKAAHGRLPLALAGGAAESKEAEVTGNSKATGKTATDKPSQEAKGDDARPAAASGSSQALVLHPSRVNAQQQGIDAKTAERLQVALTQKNPENMQALIKHSSSTALQNLQKIKYKPEYKPQTATGGKPSRPPRPDDFAVPTFPQCFPPPFHGEPEPTLDELKAAALIHAEIQRQVLNFIAELFGSQANNQNPNQLPDFASDNMQHYLLQHQDQMQDAAMHAATGHHGEAQHQAAAAAANAQNAQSNGAKLS